MKIIDERRKGARVRLLHESALTSLAREAELLVQDTGAASIAFTAPSDAGVAGSYGYKNECDYAAALAAPGQETVVKVVRGKGTNNPPGCEAIAVRVLGEWARIFARRYSLGFHKLALEWQKRRG